MERNKTVGLVISLLLALSGVALIAYAPSSQTRIKPGEYTGTTEGKIVSFLDREWVLVSPPDVNGLAVNRVNGPYYFISVDDVNRTLDILRQKGVLLFYRDAVVEVNVDVGEVVELNLPAYVLPNHNMGDSVVVQYDLVISANGVYGVAQEITP